MSVGVELRVVSALGGVGFVLRCWIGFGGDESGGGVVVGFAGVGVGVAGLELASRIWCWRCELVWRQRSGVVVAGVGVRCGRSGVGVAGVESCSLIGVGVAGWSRWGRSWVGVAEWSWSPVV